jgi:hypothetical protein
MPREETTTFFSSRRKRSSVPDWNTKGGLWRHESRNVRVNASFSKTSTSRVDYGLARLTNG